MKYNREKEIHRYRKTTYFIFHKSGLFHSEGRTCAVWNESLGFLFWHWALAHLPNYTVKHNADAHTPSVCTSICLQAFKGKYDVFEKASKCSVFCFSLALSRRGFRSSRYICAEAQSHSHAPACLPARPVICQLVALVCMSWQGGQLWVVTFTGALFPVAQRQKRHLRAVAVNLKQTAADRIKQRVRLNKRSWFHESVDVIGCHPGNEKETCLHVVLNQHPQAILNGSDTA